MVLISASISGLHCGTMLVLPWQPVAKQLTRSSNWTLHQR
jgi:hypothetical protein